MFVIATLCEPLLQIEMRSFTWLQSSAIQLAPANRIWLDQSISKRHLR
jgi:hypothetical protein